MRRSICITLLVLIVTVLCGNLAYARDGWPAKIDAGLGIGSRKESRFLVMAEGEGQLQNGLMLKVGGWLVNGESETHGYLSNAYVGIDRPQFYAAVGQKFVVFGPAGLLVSPGARGAEAVIKGTPINIHLLGGKTQFTPPAGISGRVTPNTEPTFGEDRDNEEFFAARAEYDLLKAGYNIYLGINALWSVSENGASIDWEAPAGRDKTLYAEAASFDGENALLGGIRFDDVRKYFHTSRDTSLDIFWKEVPNDYIPAVVGACQYYADRDGLSASLSHEISALSEIELYGDSRGVTLNFMRHFSLED